MFIMMWLTLEIPISMTKDWHIINGRCDNNKYRVFKIEQNTNPSEMQLQKGCVQYITLILITFPESDLKY